MLGSLTGKADRCFYPWSFTELPLMTCDTAWIGLHLILGRQRTQQEHHKQACGQKVKPSSEPQCHFLVKYVTAPHTVYPVWLDSNYRCDPINGTSRRYRHRNFSVLGIIPRKKLSFQLTYKMVCNAKYIALPSPEGAISPLSSSWLSKPTDSMNARRCHRPLSKRAT